MITAGLRSLERSDAVAAVQYFTAAYRCGMSKDSMHYFAAEIYLRNGAIDTALTFNLALERNGGVARELWLEQRARIFRVIGWKRAADSLTALFNTGGRHDFSVSVSGSRSGLKIGKISFMPQRKLYAPASDIDDFGKYAFGYRWSRYGAGPFPKIFVRLDANSDQQLPTRFSFDEPSDTLLRMVGIAFGCGDFPLTPELEFNYRAQIHSDGKTDHFTAGRLSTSIGKVGILSAGPDIKWIKDQGIDDARTEISFLCIPKVRKGRTAIGLSVSHHYAKSDFYQNRLDNNGIYRPVPVGFVVVDSLISGQRYKYYRDRDLTTRYEIPAGELPDMSAYWSGQSGMMLLNPLPEHDVGVALKNTFSFVLPWKIDATLLSFIQCRWFHGKIGWYSVDKPIERLPYQVYREFGIVVDAADGQLYLNTDRTNVNYHDTQLKELRYHEKQRVDWYLSPSVHIEKRFEPVGKIYIMASYLKGFSTLCDDDPIARLEYLWQISAGWKKEFMVIGR